MTPESEATLTKSRFRYVISDDIISKASPIFWGVNMNSNRGSDMKNLRQMLGAITVCAIGAAGVGVAVSPALADNLNPDNSCQLTANTPTRTGTVTVNGYGGRGNCANPATVTLRVREDVSGWFDNDLVTSQRTGVTNEYWTVSESGVRGRVYFTETLSSTGASLQSARITR